MKVVKVLLKIIGAIILLSLIIVGGYIARNYIIVSKLAKAYDEILSTSNYSYSVTQITNYMMGDIDDNSEVKTEKNIIKYYYKDGKSLCHSENITGGRWGTLKGTLHLYDENLQEETTIFLKEASDNPDDVSEGLIMNYSGKSENEMNNVENLLSQCSSLRGILRYVITIEEVDGVECYAFYPVNASGIHRDWLGYYFNKETGRLFKYIDGDNVSFYENWETNSVKDEDVEIDMTGFKITDLRTRKTISN